MSLKDDLSKRKLPSVPFTVQKSDPSAEQAALQKAQAMLRQAELKDDKPEIRKRKAAVTRAQKKLEACFTAFEIRALPPPRYEELIDEHPPTEDQLKAAGNGPSERPEWNDATFYPAVLAEAVDDDMTAEDWTEFIEHGLSRGERRQLEYSVIAVNENVRLPESMMLPKGSLGTGISSLR